MKPILEAIKEAKAAAGMSDAEFAKAIGTSRPTTNAYLNGRKNPGLIVVQRMCDVLRLELVQRP